MNAKKAFKNFFYSILSQIVTICLGLAIPRMIMIEYGSEINGLLSSVTQLIVYLNLFEAGLHMVAEQSLYKPISIDDRTAISRILSAVHISYRKTGAVYLGALLVVATVYPYVLPDEDLQYGTVFFVVVLSGLGNVILFFFQGKYKILLAAEGKNYIITNLQTIISVLTNVIKILCITLGFDIVMVVLISFIISMVQAVYIYLLIRAKYSWLDLKSPPDYAAISQKNFALVHELAGMVFYNTDVLIITVFCGLKAVSIYSVYKLITSHLSSVLCSFYTSINFALGQKFSVDRLSFACIIDVVNVYFGGICFAAYTVAAGLFLPFIGLYTKGVTDIAYADKYLCLLFVVAEVLTLARMPMLNTINFAGHFKNTLPQSMLETAINLLVSLCSVRIWGIHGVLLGTIAALIYRNAEVFLYANQKILHRSARKTFCIYALDAAVFILALLVMSIRQFQIETYLDFIKSGLQLTPLMLGIYLVVLSIFFPDERKMMLQIVKAILSRYC